MKRRYLTVAAIVLAGIVLSLLLATSIFAAPQNPPLNVNVINTPLPVDISGWLHTTQNDEVRLDIPTYSGGSVDIQTRGYRTLTLMFDANDTCGLWVNTLVYDCFSHTEDKFSYDPFVHGRFVKTYEIRGYNMTINVNTSYMDGNTYDHPVHVDIRWYMTT